MSGATFPRWRAEAWPIRLALSVLLLVLLGGLFASGRYLAEHLEKRDDRPGLTLDDVRAHYHGVRREAPVRAILERGHADAAADAALTASERALLLGWLAGGRLSEDYDNLDLGDAAPAEIIAARCVSCHARAPAQAEGGAPALPLESWPDVKLVAFAQEVEATAPAIILASLHTHALGMALVALSTLLLLLGTSWPRPLLGLLALILSLGLAADLASWLLARTNDAWVFAIAGGGAAFAAATALSLLLVLVDLWRPGPRAGRETTS